MNKKLLNVVLMASFVSIAGLAGESNLDGHGKGGGAAFKPSHPGGGVSVHPNPLGLKPIGIVGFKPPHPVGIVVGHKPPVIGLIGVKPPTVGIVVGKPPHPVGIVIGHKPPVVGIIIGHKPPVIGIVGHKPPVIGIIGHKPPVIGIVIPKPPHKPPHWPTWPHKPYPPHYPQYPYWPHRPHCPAYVSGGTYQPIEIAEPYPMSQAPQEGQLVLNLQCALPESAKAQELSTVNVNLIMRANDYEVVGTVNDANNSPFNVTTTATGGTDESKVSLRLPEGDEVYLEAVQQEGVTYYQGSIRLLGRSDKNGLVCQLTQLTQ